MKNQLMSPANVVRSLLIHWATTACGCGDTPEPCAVHSRGGQEKMGIAEAVALMLDGKVLPGQNLQERGERS